MKTKAYAILEKGEKLVETEIERRDLDPNDVQIEILYSGICHSDIHTAREEWGDIDYPCVPGHEIIGKVTSVGSNVEEFSVGDTAGVGVFVNSCQKCHACVNGYQNYCEKGMIKTYGSIDPKDDSVTYGGYSQSIVVDQNYVFKIPSNLDISKAAPLLCAGITMYSPLKQWEVKPGSKVGIIGLGGLGHMGVKFAKAMGAEVYVFTTSEDKIEDAKRFGADHVVLSNDEAAMSELFRKLDLLVDTIPVEHDLSKYLEVLGINGTIVLVGPINPMPGYHGGQLISGRKSIAGSGIGGVEETKEMLDFAAKNNILPEVDHIQIESINDAWDQIVSKDTSHRYVIDMASSFGV